MLPPTAGSFKMASSEDDDTRELSHRLSVDDELQIGLAVLRRRLNAIKISLPRRDPGRNIPANSNEAE
jgi:hypothetical protein